MRFKDTPAAKVLHGDCADLLRDRVPTLQEMHILLGLEQQKGIYRSSTNWIRSLLTQV